MEDMTEGSPDNPAWTMTTANERARAKLLAALPERLADLTKYTAGLLHVAVRGNMAGVPDEMLLRCAGDLATHAAEVGAILMGLAGVTIGEGNDQNRAE